MADCAIYDLACHAKSSFTGAVTGVVESAFEKMCQQFADAGAAVLRAVAEAFLAGSTVNLAEAGIDRLLLVSTSIGMSLAVLLLLGQVIRAALTMRGDYLAAGLVGVLKAGIATACVLSVATLLLAAADGLSVMILDQAFGSTEEFTERFATAVTFTGLGNGNPAAPVALLLVFGLLAIGVGAVLFGEMLFRHAAIVLIVATAPIGAAGLVSGATVDWWRKLVTTGIQLIFLKPLIVLIFAVGFSVAGESADVLGVMAGLVTLLIAAIAWPILARFCTWTATRAKDEGGFTSFVGGYLGAQATRLPGKVMSTQARGSSFDSDRATIARNTAAMDATFTKPAAGGGASAAAGANGFAAAAGTATAVKERLRTGTDTAAPHDGPGRAAPTPSSGPPPGNAGAYGSPPMSSPPRRRSPDGPSNGDPT